MSQPQLVAKYTTVWVHKVWTGGNHKNIYKVWLTIPTIILLTSKISAFYFWTQMALTESDTVHFLCQSQGGCCSNTTHWANFFKRMQCGKIVGHGKRERRRWQKFNCQNRPPFNLWWNTLVYSFAIFNLIFSCSWLVWAAGRKCWNIVKHNIRLKALISLRPEGVGPSIIV